MQISVLKLFPQIGGKIFVTFYINPPHMSISSLTPPNFLDPLAPLQLIHHPPYCEFKPSQHPLHPFHLPSLLETQ